MNSITSFLNGKKTYLTALALGILTVLHSLGKINDSTFQQGSVLIGSFSIAALRAAIASKI